MVVMMTTTTMRLVFLSVVEIENTNLLMDGIARMMHGCAIESNCALQHLQVLLVETMVLDVIH
eukprot:437312-Amphidinium_carterae.1